MKSRDLTNLISGNICREAADEFLVSVRMRRTDMDRTGCGWVSDYDVDMTDLKARDRLWTTEIPCMTSLCNCPV